MTSHRGTNTRPPHPKKNKHKKQTNYDNDTLSDQNSGVI